MYQAQVRQGNRRAGGCLVHTLGPALTFCFFASFWYSPSSSYFPTSSVCFSSAFRTASFEHSTTFCSNFYLHIPYQTHKAQRGQGVGKTKTEKDSQWPRWTSRFLPWRLDFPDLRSLSLARYICHTWGSLEKPMDSYNWKLWYMSFWNPRSLLWLSHLLWLFKNPLPLAQISKKKNLYWSNLLIPVSSSHRKYLFKPLLGTYNVLNNYK